MRQTKRQGDDLLSKLVNKTCFQRTVGLYTVLHDRRIYRALGNDPSVLMIY